jgi:hypothetical protein
VPAVVEENGELHLRGDNDATMLEAVFDLGKNDLEDFLRDAKLVPVLKPREGVEVLRAPAAALEQVHLLVVLVTIIEGLLLRLPCSSDGRSTEKEEENLSLDHVSSTSRLVSCKSS